GHPLIYVLTWEESRVERLAQHLAKTFYGAPASYGTWSVVDGLAIDGSAVPDTRDPLRALEAILAAPGKGFLVLKDFPTVGRLESLRLAPDLRRARVPRDPLREGADVEEGGGARVRPSPFLARRRRRILGAEDVAPEAAGALLEGRARCRHPDPQGDSSHGDL